MTRHPTARRVHHRATEPDDAFVAGVLESTAWAKQHSRKLIIGGIIAAVVLAAAVLFLLNRRNTTERAAAQLTQVRAVALTGDAQSAIPVLEQYLDDFGGSRHAGEARLLLGRAYLDAGQPQKAIETVQNTARDVNSQYGANAAYLLASAYEAAQEPHRAEEVFLRLGEDARFTYMKQDALDNAARIRLQRGNPAGAVELYQRLIELSPAGSTERQVFELRLGEAQALAATAGSAPAAGAAAPSPAATPPEAVQGQPAAPPVPQGAAPTTGG